MPARALVLSRALGAAASVAARPAEGQVDTAALAGRVDSLATVLLEAQFERFPESATYVGRPGADHGRIVDNTLAADSAWQRRIDELRGAAAGIDPAALADRPEGVLLAIVREQLDADVATRICRRELWNVASYVNGWQARYTDLALVQPVGSDELRAAALRRAGALPRFLDTEIANLRVGLREGYSAPQAIVRAVIEQLDDLLATPPDSSPFHSPAERDRAPAFGAALARIIETELYPAIRRYRDFLAAEYLPHARAEIGVAQHPNGVACYQATVRSFTTAEPSPDSIFAQGLAAMARIETEMREIAARSFDGEPLATLLPRLRTDPRYTFRTEQEIIDSSQAAMNRSRAAAPRWFGRLPRAEVVSRPYPAFRQRAGAPGQYEAAPDDGSRPAIFLINPFEPQRKSRADVENVAFHEAVPGHHLQVGIMRELRDVHPLVRFSGNAGFGEGWALYAERLADEMGLYSSELGRLGLLSSEAFRAARMVIDAGIHTKGWTRQQALDYLLAHTVIAERTAEGEIDRYISWPGQAPSYMLGAMEIRSLREEARQALGARFDIRAFHDRVLEDGAVPLSQLRMKIRRWIAVETASAAGRR